MDRTASGQKFVALPWARNGRSPIMWQIELIDQVTWCSTAMRTSPAQKNAVNAPQNDMRDQAAEQGRGEQADRGPQRELSADPGDVAVGEQVGGEAGGVGAVAPEQPAEVGVAEALGQRDGAGAEQPGRVRVALLVGEGVVAAVVGGPGDHVTLPGQAAGDGEGVAQRPVRLERAVGEVAVEADGDAERAEQVEADGEADIDPAQAPTPGQR